MFRLSKTATARTEKGENLTNLAYPDEASTFSSPVSLSWQRRRDAQSSSKGSRIGPGWQFQILILQSWVVHQFMTDIQNRSKMNHLNRQFPTWGTREISKGAGNSRLMGYLTIFWCLGVYEHKKFGNCWSEWIYKEWKCLPVRQQTESELSAVGSCGSLCRKVEVLARKLDIPPRTCLLDNKVILLSNKPLNTPEFRYTDNVIITYNELPFLHFIIKMSLFVITNTSSYKETSHVVRSPYKT